MKSIFHQLPPELLTAGAVLLALAATTACLWAIFFRRSGAERRAVVQEWLLWAVASAERYLGSGTGEKKLALVYQWFGIRFPLMAHLISWDEFRSMVEEALEQLESFLLDDAITEMMIGVISDEE